jgi:hypothetical protein
LAYEIFQGCRHDDGSGARRNRLATLLDLLIYTWEEVDRTGNLEVEFLTSSLASFDLRPDYGVDALEPRHQVNGLPSEQQRLLELIRASTVELKRLCSANPPVAVTCSLGYALHELPDLVRDGGYEATFFLQWGFRVAAYAWSDLSIEMRQILCELAETSIDRAEKLITRDGFAVKIYSGDGRPNVPLREPLGGASSVDA